jgi:hypothetical protein
MQAEKINKRGGQYYLMTFFKRDDEKYEGVPRMNIYLLRLPFTLMFVFLTFESWSTIIRHTGLWDGTRAAAWCMWASYSVISFIGILKPLKMLPIVLFEIVYKVTWLLIVAYPLWVKGELKGSAVEGMANVYIWVVLPVVAMPWRYFFYNYVWVLKRKKL